MARTYTWDEAYIPGGSSADQIDDGIRRTRVEMREFINQLLGLSEATALSDPLFAWSGTKHLYVPGTACRFYQSVGTYSMPATLSTVVKATQASHGSSPAFVFDLQAIPVGATITKIEAFASGSSAASTLQATFYSTGLATGAVPTLNTTNFDSAFAAFSGLGTIAVSSYNPAGGVAVAVDTVFAVVLAANIAAVEGVNVYGLRVTYTLPNTFTR